MKGAYHAAIFNVFRRTRNQVLYWAPALMVGYYTMQWATERYVGSFPWQSKAEYWDNNNREYGSELGENDLLTSLLQK